MNRLITPYLAGLAVALAAAALAGASLPTVPAAAGAGAPAPALSQLPGALVSPGAAHAPLTIVLPTRSSTTVRAAVLAASAAQRAAGSTGIAVRVLMRASSSGLATAPGSVIVIDGRGTRPSLSLDRLASGHLRLTISGTGDGLLRAARLLSSPALSAFTTRRATVAAGLAPERSQAPAPATAPLTPAATSGRGRLTLASQFTLPIDRQLVGNDALRLVTAYDSSGGGRITARLGNGLLSASEVPGHGQLRSVSTTDLSDNATLTGAAVPGWWAHPGPNQLTLTASPAHFGATGMLQILSGSRLALSTRPRPAALQLGLWPFPIYNSHAWSQATVALAPVPTSATLAALVTTLANTERVTGLPADPRIALDDPAASRRAGNVIFVGSAAVAAAATLRPTQPRLPGVLDEVRLPHGGVGLLAYGTRALGALGPAYQLGAVSGRAVLVDPLGRPHLLAPGEGVALFAQPRWPWLAPAAFMAVLALGWIAYRAARTRRRLASLPAFRSDAAGGAS